MKKIISRLFGKDRASSNKQWILFFYIPVALVAISAFIGERYYGRKLVDISHVGQSTIGLSAQIPGLIERVGKLLLLIEKNSTDQKSTTANLASLKATTEQLNEIVNGFADGSDDITGIDGVKFKMSAVTDETALNSLNQITLIWDDVKDRIDSDLLSANQNSGGSAAPSLGARKLTDTINFVIAEETLLSRQLPGFTRRLETLFAQRITSYETAQNVLIFVATVSFLMLPGVYFTRKVRIARDAATALASELSSNKASLEAQTKALSTSKAETDRIMETVQEGLLLIDSQAIIGDYYSHELTSILRQDKLEGRSLLGILERLLSEKMFHTTKDYFALLFDVNRKEKAVLKVNPLTDIEVNFPNPAGGFINRYLGFSFRRIVENGVVTRVFVAVRDITTQIELEKKLRASEQHKDRQLDILLGIVHVAPSELESFVALVEKELDTINETLRAEHIAATGGQGEALRERLQNVFRSVHNIKGNAAVLQLTTFQKAADAFESKLTELLNRPQLTGDDFLSVVVAQAGLRADLGDLMELSGKLIGLRQPVAANPSASPTINSPVVQITAGLQQLVADAARDLDKATTLTIDDYALHTVAADRPALIRDVLIQLTRNSIAHSIEPSPVRLAAGKPPAATLSVRALPRTTDGLFGIAFRDDGAGLDMDAIRRRAEAAGLIASDADHTSADIARCIFSPGFSTASEVTTHAGRGMGMDIIKNKVVDEAGGAIEVHCTPGQYCEFHLYFPAV